MTEITYTRNLDPFGQLRVLPGYAVAAEQEVNLGHLRVESRGCLNKVVVILLGVEAGSHSNDHRIFRDLQFPAEGEPRGRITSEFVQIEAVRDDLHSFRCVA